MTADVALAAFAAGFAVYCQKVRLARLDDSRVRGFNTRDPLCRSSQVTRFFCSTRKQWTGVMLAAATGLPARRMVHLSFRAASHPNFPPM